MGHILLDKMGLDQMGLDQMGLDKLGIYLAINKLDLWL